jgi:hypothetical protein
MSATVDAQAPRPDVSASASSGTNLAFAAAATNSVARRHAFRDFDTILSDNGFPDRPG